MFNFDIGNTAKRLSNRYRLVITNDDTYEEVVQFKLNRGSIYVIICTIFILLVGVTIALLWFTPLKQFTPGYKQGYGVDAKYKQLKIESDSVFKITEKQKAYIDNMKIILSNMQPITNLDTTLLKIEEPAIVEKINTKK